MLKRITSLNRRNLFLSATLIIFILLTVWLVLGRIALFQTIRHKRLYKNTYILSAQTKVMQDFLAEYPGLYRIDIYFNNSVSQPSTVILHLKAYCEAVDDLKTVVISTSEIVDNTFHPFVFSPMNDSAKRKFCIVLESQTISDALGVYASRGNPYAAGEAHYEPGLILEEKEETLNFVPAHFLFLPLISKASNEFEDHQADIGFQLYYDGPAWLTLKVLLTRLALHKPGLLGDVWFYICLLTIYLISLGLLWRLVLKIRNE